MQQRFRHNRRGLSLVEVIVSTLIVGLMLAASLTAVSAVHGTRLTNNRAAAGHALAHELMGEILAAAYEDEGGAPIFGTESGEQTGDRSQFDDLDDYDDWTASPPQAKDGAALAGYAGYTRSVIVNKIDPDNGSEIGDSSSDQGLRRVTVTVVDPAGKATTLSTMRAAAGAARQPLSADAEFVTGIRAELRAGAASAVRSGGDLVNHAEDQ